LNQRQAQYSAVPDIGGTYLHNTTAGEPQQRLLIAYDRNNPEPLSRLVSLLRDQIDRPARQIVIEALVIEVNTEKLSELGFDLTAVEGEFDASFADGFDGALQPFTLTFTESEFPTSDYLQVRLSSLVARGEAEILSSPSVLVLDGRQARIQIGQQVPVVKSTATNAGIISAVDYFPVGIVLNLRPRINEAGSEVTMQVETIVSSVSQTAGSGSSDVFVAPTIDNRQVQTFVRVADNTPFIIGGLISSDSRDIESRVPILSDIPIIGRAFKRKDQDQLKKEVIVVLTPHVIPLDEPDFNYLLPQDSDAFNSFGNLLFRSAYRVRADDVFDLGFIYDSEYFQNYRRTLQSELQRTVDIEARTSLQQALRSVPGEEILVNRMIWEIVHETGFYNHVKTSNIILFNEDAAASDGSGFTTDFLGDHLPATAQSALQIELDLAERGTAERPLVQPIASLYETSVSGDDAFTRTLIEANPDVGPGQKAMRTILVSNGAQPKGVRGATSLDVLKGVLVMKKVIQLNSAMPRTLEAFREGRQLLFPSAEDLENSFHLIDFDTARLFFEVIQYYPEFEKQFKMTLSDSQIAEGVD
jgi:general secretion pathway protein D